MRVIEIPALHAERAQELVGRGWVLDAVHEWMERRSERFFLLTGEPGSGKTAIAAWLCGAQSRYEETLSPPETAALRAMREKWSAAHFCVAKDRDSTVNPSRFAAVLARQLGVRFSDYNRYVLEHVAPNVQGHASAQENWGEVVGVRINNLVINASPRETYDLSVRRPLESLAARDAGLQALILVDALDESLTGDPVTIAQLLRGSDDFPPGVRFLITSQPNAQVLNSFRQAFRLDLGDSGHQAQITADVRSYARHRLSEPALRQTLMQSAAGGTAALEDKIVEAASGNFLYLRFLLDQLANGTRHPDDLDSLPPNLHGLYHDYLDRIIPPEAQPGRAFWSAAYQPLLGSLSVAAPAAPPERLDEWIATPSAPLLSQVGAVVEEVPGRSGGFRLYHRSLAEFLATRSFAKPGETFNNAYHTPPLPQHERIAAHYFQFQGYWSQCDVYGLRQWVRHKQECVRGTQRQERARHLEELVAVVLDPEFRQAQRDGLEGDVAHGFFDLETVLRLALEEDHLLAAFRCAFVYSRMRRGAGLAQSIFEAIGQDDFSLALQRADFYRGMPNWGMTLHLYLAWEAARRGQGDVARRAIQIAWDCPLNKSDYFPQNALADAFLATTFCHLHSRSAVAMVAHALRQDVHQSPSPIPAEMAEALKELDQTCSDWKMRELLGIYGAPLETTFEYRHMMLRDATSEMDQARIQATDQRMLIMGPDFMDAEWMALNIQRVTQLFSSIVELPEGQGLFEQNLSSVSTNPYPHYRDVALIGLGAACLHGSNEEWVSTQLQKILTAGLDQEGITFRFDLAALVLMEIERRGLTASALPDYLLQSETLQDSWGTAARARSAHAAALHEIGEVAQARQLLIGTANTLDCFSGFAVLHLLSFVNRLLEWDAQDVESRDLIKKWVDLAANRADDVQDLAFREQRQHLVVEFRRWLAEPVPDETEALSRIEAITEHDVRHAYLGHVAARWSSRRLPGKIKLLLPFALSNATTQDALWALLVGPQLRQLSTVDVTQLAALCGL